MVASLRRSDGYAIRFATLSGSVEGEIWIGNNEVRIRVMEETLTLRRNYEGIGGGPWGQVEMPGPAKWDSPLLTLHLRGESGVIGVITVRRNGLAESVRQPVRPGTEQLIIEQDSPFQLKARAEHDAPAGRR